MQDTHTHVDVGERVRALRTAAGISLRTLASRTGFSPSFISQVEHGQASPSIASLERIAAALGATLVEFFEPRAQTRPAVVRADARGQLRSSWSRAEIASLGPGPAGSKLDSTLVNIAPGGRSAARPQPHPGEEFAFVLAGEVTLTLGGETHILGPGDAVTFSSGVPHAWENSGTASAQIVCVALRTGQPAEGAPPAAD